MIDTKLEPLDEATAKIIKSIEELMVERDFNITEIENLRKKKEGIIQMFGDAIKSVDENTTFFVENRNACTNSIAKMYKSYHELANAIKKGRNA